MSILGTVIVVYALMVYFTMVHASSIDENKPFFLLLFKGLVWPLYWALQWWGKHL